MRFKQKKIKEKNKNKIGGLALFNGLLLRSNTRECSVELVGEEINTNINKEIYSQDKKISFKKIFIIRGVINIFATLKNSIPYIISSVQNVVEDITNEKEEIKVNKNEIFIGYGIAIFLIFSLFYIIPNIFSMYFDESIRNIIQVILQISIFSIYLFVISKAKILKVLFEYHGAEHKVVNAYEIYGEDNLSIENVSKSSRFHLRCGGNFVMYFVVLLIIQTLIIPSNDILLKSIIQIFSTVFLIGIAYEITMIFSKLPKAISFLAYPAMMIQAITTKEPSNDKMQLAIYAMRGVLDNNLEISVKEYIDKYIGKNIKVNDYDIKDILRIVEYVKEIDFNIVFLNIKEIKLSFDDQIKMDVLLDKMYNKNIPLQYITKKQVFFNEEYIVNESVLIPRADSEILVEKAIEYINKYELKSMIDMCTGSGCIGISISKNSDIDNILLVDISNNALEVANQNIIKNYAIEKCSTINSNLFEKIIEKNIKYDIIVSNPPYIPTNDIDGLSNQVKNEPHLALDGGNSGLNIYIKIFKEAKFVLKDKGFLILEIGYDQLDSIENIIQSNNEFKLTESVKDLGGNDRVVVCRFHQI